MTRRGKPTAYSVSTGNAAIGLTKDPRGNNMMPVLTFVDVAGVAHRVDLQVSDVIALRADAGVLLDADAEQVAKWWAGLQR